MTNLTSFKENPAISMVICILLGGFIPVFASSSGQDSANSSKTDMVLSTSPANPWEVSPAEKAARKAKAHKKSAAWQKLSPLERARRSSQIHVSRKVDIFPIRKSKGIKTGLVIAYGHVIPPPYQVEVQGRNILINGIQVDPSLIEERNRREVQAGKVSSSNSHRVQLKQTDEVDRQVLAIYRAGVKERPMAQVKSDVLEFLRKSTDTYLNPEVSDTEYIAELAGSGGIRVSMPLTRKDPLNVADTTLKEEEKAARKETASMVERELQNGTCLAFVSSGYVIGLNRERLRSVNAIMRETGISDDERIDKLKTQVFHNYEVAFQVIENYQAEEWKNLEGSK